MLYKEIDIQSIEGFSIGNAEKENAEKGCTVILTDNGAVTGIDIRGGAPASRESGLLNPLAANDSVNAVVLSGGSAFGLNTADGVMKYLEEKGQGFPTAAGVVPIVCTSCIFDLRVGDPKNRPDAETGYQACLNAGNYQDGNHGAGTGATVGKLLGEEHMMKAGIGSYAIQFQDLKLGAIVVVNAAGNVVDPSTGKIIAGVHDTEGNFIDGDEALLSMMNPDSMFGTNTTIGAVITNASFNKTECTKIAGMAHDGFARAIRPVHTMFDGDSIYCMSKGTVKADINIVGALSAMVMEKAILNAVKHVRVQA